MVGDDPMFWSRLILAANRGSLMELGIGPIITAGMVLQLLVGAKLISMDSSNEEDKVLMENAKKILSIVIGFFEAFAYVYGGMYGDISVIGSFNALLIILQLTFASVLVMLLDEVLDKGYGIGSATSLFIATNVCEEFLWKSFSPLFEKGEYQGVFIALFHFLATTPNKFLALKKAFYRDTFANLNNIIATLFVFCIVNFLQGFAVNIAIHNKQVKGHVGSYPIKMFYTSNMPIILQSTLVSNLFFVSRLLYKKFGTFTAIKWLGRWKEASIGGQSYPISGLIYYISTPSSVRNMLDDPLHMVTYILFVLISCAIFSRTWIEISGSSPKDVIKSLKNENITAYGGSEVLLEKKLKKYIHTAALLGGAAIGVLSIFADFLGTIGSGTGILLTCNIIFEFYEEYSKESAKYGGIF